MRQLTRERINVVDVMRISLDASTASAVLVLVNVLRRSHKSLVLYTHLIARPVQPAPVRSASKRGRVLHALLAAMLQMPQAMPLLVLFDAFNRCVAEPSRSAKRAEALAARCEALRWPRHLSPAKGLWIP